jgi:hypothetical protein
VQGKLLESDVFDVILIDNNDDSHSQTPRASPDEIEGEEDNTTDPQDFREDIMMSNNEGEHMSDGEPGEDHEGVVDFPEDDQEAQEDDHAMWDMAIDPSSIAPDVAVPDLQSHTPMKVIPVGHRSVNLVVGMLTDTSCRAKKEETLGVKFVNSKKP